MVASSTTSRHSADVSFPDDVPTLTDGAVTLRAHRPDDAPRVIEQCTDPASVRWTQVPSPYGAEQARDFLETRVAGSWDSGATWIFAIEHEGLFAGTVDLRPHGLGEAEIGFGLHPSARGHGVARRAVALLLDWAVAEHDVAVVHWRCDEGNWASRRTAWALGFRFGPTIPARRGRPDRWTAWWGRDDARVPTTRWLSPVELVGDGVRLRAWGPGDGSALVEAAHDPVLRAAIPHSPLPVTADEVASYLLQVEVRAAQGERVAWCVESTDTGQVLGNVALFGFEDGSAEVGCWAHPAGRGRGAIATALRLVVDHALAELDVRRLDVLTAATNHAARRLATRAGFDLVGIETATMPTTDGGWAGTARYELVPG